MVWQLVQFSVVGMCAVVLPLALVPWQLAQFVGKFSAAWLGLSTAQDTVDLWQVSHNVTFACTSVLGLPTADRNWPEWQLAQAGNGTICVWFQNDGFHAVVVWQLRQFAVPTGM